MDARFRKLLPLSLWLSLVAGVTACGADSGDPGKDETAGGGGSTGKRSVTPTMTGTRSTTSTGTPYGASQSTSSGAPAAGASGTFSASATSPASDVSASSSSPPATSTAGSEASEAGASPEDAGGIADATAAAEAAPVETPTSIEVEYYTVDPGGGQTSQIQCDLKIVNTSASAIDLSGVTVRYWLTADGNTIADAYFISYYSQNSTGSQDITASVSGAFAPATGADVTSTSDGVLELSFASGAGSLAPNGGYALMQVAIHGPGATGYSDEFTETNDYSYDSTKTESTSYQPWTHVTAYVGGQIVWGVEPGGLSSVAADSGSPAGDGAADDAEPPSDAATGEAAAEDAAVATDAAAQDAAVADAASPDSGADDATAPDAATAPDDATVAGDGGAASDASAAEDADDA
ncbi:MAG: hypothetical protein FWD17_18375, partial [Polyangiaceae bacterium]|nr:hypothetical protein [Polyangiaceae bacterium]